jgi:hypothetical protein
MPSVTNLIGLGMPAELSAEVANGTFATVTSTAAINATAGGIRTRQAINNVNDTTPTAAELTTSFGTPASVGTGFVGVVKDADVDTNCYVVVSNGVSYFYLKFTKAV